MNKFLIINLLWAVLIWVGDCLYLQTGALLAKGLTSAAFVLMGVTNLIYLICQKHRDYRFPATMLVGLGFAMLGDIVLNLHFIAGAVLFALGHVCFFVAYCLAQPFHWTDLIYGAVILVPAGLFILLAPMFDFGGVLMQVVCVVYATIISLMVGKAIANLVRAKDTQSLLVMMGSILFLFSDLMLLINVFSAAPRIFDVLCLATYYPAEAILAFTIWGSHQKEKEVSK